MGFGRTSLVLAAAFAATLTAPVDALARRGRVACRDGQPVVTRRCPAGCPEPPVRCDTDGSCNGICTFLVKQCTGDFAGVDQMVEVAVGEQRVVIVSTAPPRSTVLRCRAVGAILCAGRGCTSNADCPACKGESPVGCQCIEGRCR